MEASGSSGVPHIVVDKIIDCKVTEEVQFHYIENYFSINYQTILYFTLLIFCFILKLYMQSNDN